MNDTPEHTHPGSNDIAPGNFVGVHRFNTTASTMPNRANVPIIMAIPYLLVFCPIIRVIVNDRFFCWACSFKITTLKDKW